MRYFLTFLSLLLLISIVNAQGKFEGGIGSGYASTQITTSTSSATSKFSGGVGSGYSSDLLDNTTLPVVLMNFNVSKKEDNILISWSTASEINSDYFEIQRSNDGLAFQAIGRVKAKGTSYEMTNYEFVHQKSILLQTSYFRLKMVDFDNSFDFSKTIKIDGTSDFNRATINIYPNPTMDIIKIEIIGSEEKLNFTLYNSSGVELAKPPIIKERTINLSYLSAGIYYWQLTNGDLVIKNGKIIKL